jgi:hypothetical protein
MEDKSQRRFAGNMGGAGQADGLRQSDAAEAEPSLSAARAGAID